MIKPFTYGRLRIYGIALSNQNVLPAFFRPRKVNLKIGLFLEDDLPRMAKSRKITYRDWPNRSPQQVGISKED
jgi:hypothetical protein